MERKDPSKDSEKVPTVRNLCWPLDGQDQEQCISDYEGAVEKEEEKEDTPDKAGKL